MDRISKNNDNAGGERTKKAEPQEDTEIKKLFNCQTVILLMPHLMM